MPFVAEWLDTFRLAGIPPFCWRAFCIMSLCFRLTCYFAPTALAIDSAARRRAFAKQVLQWPHKLGQLPDGIHPRPAPEFTLRASLLPLG
jgi:hypothetical protein